MLFKNATLCDYQGIKKADLRTQNGFITDIGSLQALKDENIYDVEDKLLFPAMIDLNIAPKSLSLSRKNLLALAQKALKGGVGSILLYPHTSPSCSENGSIELIKSLNKESPIHLLPAINPLDSQGKLSDISTLHNNGGKAIFTRSDIDAHNLMSIAQYAQMLHIPLICFCQDKSVADGVMNEGILSASLGLPSIPAYSQTKEVAKIAEMFKNVPIKLIFDTLVYPRSFEILQSFKATYNKDSMQFTENPQFFTQTSIHHLILDEGLCENYNTAAKLNPPLVDKNAQSQLIEMLQNGHIDTLTSLQCADFNSKKDQVFELASFGVDALEVYFSLLYTYLHKSYDISLPLISQLTSYTPAQILSLNKGALQKGKIAELFIVNPHAHFTLNDTFSPYHQHKLYGKIEAFLSNETLYTPHTKES
ncbi:metal-dependent hydrolase [Helicobacter sp. MIT 21-1697]|uniref:metal-dependent hydrolase n=1 Tax=Helicobacter sp. MIT 21-1697 TaxID=2993733 RepID=UPI00224B8705|nr:metal-dependent hydrolase [Helicobacter sp. MIT 21-1697]MCX2716685.1 metal-dependent hydrolase [Helicobacter sp. MIT 21-1697]